MIPDRVSVMRINLDAAGEWAGMNESSAPSKKQEYYIHFNLLFFKASLSQLTLTQL